VRGKMIKCKECGKDFTYEPYYKYELWIPFKEFFGWYESKDLCLTCYDKTVKITDEIKEDYNRRQEILRSMWNEKRDYSNQEAADFLAGRKPYKNIFGEEKGFYDTRNEAEYFRRRGDKIFYNSHMKKYYTKRVEDPFWG
jgi:hypothetical protein